MGGQAIIGSARLIIYPKDILSVEGGRFERWRLGSLNLPRDGADGRHEKKKMRHVPTSPQSLRSLKDPVGQFCTFARASLRLRTLARTRPGPCLFILIVTIFQ